MASVVGLYTGEDVSLGGATFNKISDDQCAWIITDLEGWWGLPDVDVADDPKTQTLDGSYFTFGRYLPRTVTIRGQILPLDGIANKAVAARSALNRVLAPLARSRVLLSVQEDNPKVALVQLAGAPLTRIDKTTGQLTFDIILRAVDPVKYSEIVTIESTTLAATSPGRTYNRTYYYSYGGKTTSGTLTVNNIGSYQSDAIFTITGPVTRPRIEHVEQGVFLEFNVVLGVGETLTINTRTKKILFGGASRRSTLTPQSRWFSLTPGTNSIRYSGIQQIPAQVELPAGTNLLTNPSFETISDTVEVRRNIFINPRVSSINGWSRYAGTSGVESSAIQTVTGFPFSITQAYRMTWTTSPTTVSGGIYFGNSTTTTPATPGVTYTGSMYIRSSVARTYTPRIEWKNSASGTITTTSGTPVVVAAGEVVRVSVSGVAPEGTVCGVIAAYASAGPVPVPGEYVEGSAALWEISPVILPYLDGSISQDSDLTPVWTGTANSSASVLRGTRVDTATGGISVSSTQWFASGTKSLRIIAAVGSNYNAIGGDLGALRNGLTPGKTYTVIASCRLSAAQTGSLDANARRVVAYTRIGTGAYTTSVSNQAPNAPGSTEVRLAFTVPLGATEAFIRLFGGAPYAGGGDVWWDNVILVEGDYSGAYFDGSFPHASWTGTPNASTSVRPLVPEVPETMLQLSYRDAWID